MENLAYGSAVRGTPIAKSAVAEQQFLTVEETLSEIKRLGVTLNRTALYELMAAGRIANVKLGRRRYVPFDEPAAFVKRLMDQAKSEQAVA